jgi:malonyl CoA-acyl carrier protein transacylase
VDPQPLDLVDSLAAQVACPVRWQRSVERLARACPAATFVEVGPGTGLRDLLGRRGPSVRRAATDAPAGVAPAAHFRATVAALSALAASAPAVRLH